MSVDPSSVEQRKRDSGRATAAYLDAITANASTVNYGDITHPYDTPIVTPPKSSQPSQSPQTSPQQQPVSNPFYPTGSVGGSGPKSQASKSLGDEILTRAGIAVSPASEPKAQQQSSQYGIVIIGGPKDSSNRLPNNPYVFGSPEYYREEMRQSKTAEAARVSAPITIENKPKYADFEKEVFGGATYSYNAAGEPVGVTLDPSILSKYNLKGKTEVKKGEDGDFYSYYHASPDEYADLYGSSTSYDISAADRARISNEALGIINKEGGSVTAERLNNKVAELLGTKYAEGIPQDQTAEERANAERAGYSGFKANAIIAGLNAGNVDSAFSLNANDKSALKESGVDVGKLDRDISNAVGEIRTNQKLIAEDNAYNTTGFVPDASPLYPSPSIGLRRSAPGRTESLTPSGQIMAGATYKLDNISVAPPSSDKKSAPPDALKDLYEGTVGYAGAFIAEGARDIGPRIGRAKEGEDLANSIEKSLGLDQNNLPISIGGLGQSGFNILASNLTGDTERAKKESDAFDYAVQYRSEHPIGFAAASAIDIIPSIVGVKIGKGVSKGGAVREVPEGENAGVGRGKGGEEFDITAVPREGEGYRVSRSFEKSPLLPGESKASNYIESVKTSITSGNILNIGKAAVKPLGKSVKYDRYGLTGPEVEPLDFSTTSEPITSSEPTISPEPTPTEPTISPTTQNILDSISQDVRIPPEEAGIMPPKPDFGQGPKGKPGPNVGMRALQDIANASGSAKNAIVANLKNLGRGAATGKERSQLLGERQQGLEKLQNVDKKKYSLSKQNAGGYNPYDFSQSPKPGQVPKDYRAYTKSNQILGLEQRPVARGAPIQKPREISVYPAGSVLEPKKKSKSNGSSTGSYAYYSNENFGYAKAKSKRGHVEPVLDYSHITPPGYRQPSSREREGITVFPEVRRGESSREGPGSISELLKIPEPKQPQRPRKPEDSGFLIPNVPAHGGFLLPDLGRQQSVNVTSRRIPTSTPTTGIDLGFVQVPKVGERTTTLTKTETPTRRVPRYDIPKIPLPNVEGAGGFGGSSGSKGRGASKVARRATPNPFLPSLSTDLDVGLDAGSKAFGNTGGDLLGLGTGKGGKRRKGKKSDNLLGGLF